MYDNFSASLSLNTDDLESLNPSDVAVLLRRFADELDDGHLANYADDPSGNIAGYYEFS